MWNRRLLLFFLIECFRLDWVVLCTPFGQIEHEVNFNGRGLDRHLSQQSNIMRMKRRNRKKEDSSFESYPVVFASVW